MAERRDKPLVIFDGQCGFCRKSVEGWRAGTADRIDYAPFQEVAHQFPEIPQAEFENAVQLIDVDGSRCSGAEAVFRVMAHVPGKGWWFWLYRRLPGFAPVSRLVYRWVAANRSLVSSFTWWLWGRHVGPSTYFLSRQLYLRLLGAIYLIAFWSFAVQARGLVGERGILPVGEYLARVQKTLGDSAYKAVPTLCWLDSSDFFLTWVLCGGGIACSILLIVGLAPTLLLILLWALYLSVVCAGQTFMNFQWDILLLEAGFISIFYAPLRLSLSSRGAAPPAGAAHFLIKWLLFRLMFQSGIVKLTAGDDTWTDLTALLYHYETQPLATWTSWYAHHFPLWFQKLSVALMFFVELAAPVALFGPRRLRHAACAAIVGLMAFIGTTGNYNFFNLLTAVLCVAMLDDALLRRITPRNLYEKFVERARTGEFYFRRIALGLIAAVIVAYSALDGLQRSAGAKRPEWITRTLKWQQWEKVTNAVRPFRSINSYGLFRVMTRTRPEIVVEWSEDGRTWHELEFKWKPGDLNRPPGFVQPHQPRLDWQMWFAALGRYENQPWLQAFLHKLLEGNPPSPEADAGSSPILNLLAADDREPAQRRFVRAKLYNYEFTDPGEGPQWWKRQFVRMYSPTLSASR